MKAQVDADHYLDGYDGKKRFCSYWNQIESVLSLGSHPVLEVGVGNRLVNDYLVRSGVPVTTLDVAQDLFPDYIGSVHSMPFEDEAFGTVMACQVLEHLPYEMFTTSLSEISRVTGRYAVISLPNAARAWPFQFHIPKVGTKKYLLEFGRHFSKGNFYPGNEHYWELGWTGYSLQKILSAMEQSGFEVLSSYRVFEFPYHHFFILRKMSR